MYDVDPFPAIVNIKTNNTCNLRCLHCPIAFTRKQKKIKPMSMSWDIFTRVVDEVASHQSTLRCVNDGEPLIHRDILKQIAYIRDSDLRSFSINTNGYFLQGDIVEELLKPSDLMIAIEVSLDAFRKDTYERIRAGSDHERVMGNISTLLSERKKRKADHIRFIVSFVNFEENRDEVEAFREYWNEKADGVVIRHYTDWNGKLPYKKEAVEAEEFPCIVPFNRVVVAWDGKVYFCVADFGCVESIGDFRESSLSDIWNGEEYANFRKDHLQLKFAGDTGKYSICYRCNMKHLMPRDRNYLDVLEGVR